MVRWMVAAVALAAAGGGARCAGARCHFHTCALDPTGPSAAYLRARGHRVAALASRAALGPPAAVARSVRHGTIDCFEAGSRAPGRPDRLAFCEGSAVTFDGGRLVVASDKPIPGRARSSLFELPFSPGDGTVARRATRYLQGPPFSTARKLEDATRTPDGKRVFLTTGFDRVKAGGDRSWDGYNLLLSFPVDAPDQAWVVGPDPAARPTSVALREVLGPHLVTPGFPDGAPYFKVEGLAAGPDQRLLFGIRELGASYQAFEYALIVLEARWRREGRAIVLDPDSVRVIYRRDRLEVEGHRVGLSSLEYDPAAERYWMLVSYEHEEDRDAVGARSRLGGFLLSIDEEEMRADAPPRPVVGPSGRVVHFVNKPEGLAVVAPGTAVVVAFDDDRVLDCARGDHQHRRQPHQTGLGVVELEPLTSYASRP